MLNFISDARAVVTKYANSPCDVQRQGGCTRVEVHGSNFFDDVKLNLQGTFVMEVNHVNSVLYPQTINLFTSKCAKGNIIKGFKHHFVCFRFICKTHILNQ